MSYTHSPFSEVCVNKLPFIIKRDDLLDMRFSGNKARKLYYFLNNDFPSIKKIVSFGGSQSNFMYALSELAKVKQWSFDYYTRELPGVLKNKPEGNIKLSLDNGMKLIEVDNRQLNLTEIRGFYQSQENIYFFNQGGSQEECELGMMQLATEIIEYVNKLKILKYSIYLPSGTGASAFYLQQFLPKSYVKTCSCVGSSQYLTSQMQSLAMGKDVNYPVILDSKHKFNFGQLDIRLLDMYKKLQLETNITFDLLYDPIGWITLLENYHIFNEEPIIYIHCGGLSGNATMLNRYRRYESRGIL
jgi:1-aminocyclopropane-1-carboxylate deaminase